MESAAAAELSSPHLSSSSSSWEVSSSDANTADSTKHSWPHAPWMYPPAEGLERISFTVAEVPLTSSTMNSTLALCLRKVSSQVSAPATATAAGNWES